MVEVAKPMTKKRIHHPGVIALLFIIPLALIAAVYIFSQPKTVVKPEFPTLDFRESTAPGIIYKPEPELTVSGVHVETPDDPEYIKSHLSFRNDGRILLATVYGCIIFEQDGTEIERYQLAEVPDEMFEEEGIDPSDGRQLMHPAYLETIHGTRNGDVWALFQLPCDNDLVESEGYSVYENYMPVIAVWNESGELESVIDLEPDFFPFAFLCSKYGPNWSVGSYRDTVIVALNEGAFKLFRPGNESEVMQFERLRTWFKMYGVILWEDCIMVRGSDSGRYNLDGTFDWDYLRNRSRISQRVPTGDNTIWGSNDLVGYYWYSLDGDEYMVTYNGLCKISDSGQVQEIIATRETIHTIFNQTPFNSYTRQHSFTLSSLDDGWLLLPYSPFEIWTESSYAWTIGAIQTDIDLNPIETIEFLTDQSENLLENKGEECPIYEVGDTIDLRYIYTDFQLVPGGYQYIDHTLRRFITINENFEVIDVLDRSEEIPNGRWQDIDQCRIDSRGYYYLFDFDEKLIQVLDPDGNYVRKFERLGEVILGYPEFFKLIEIDTLDRLWVINDNRIFVIDRDGNLVRYFRTLNARQQRSTQLEGISNLPTENQPVGYTILPAQSGYTGGFDPQTPIELDISGMSWLGLAGGSLPVGYFYAMDQSSREIVLFDWLGREHASFNPRDFVSGWRSLLIIGPDGFPMVIDPVEGQITVLDPYGEETGVIVSDGMPIPGYGFTNVNMDRSKLTYSASLVFTDAQNRLVLAGNDPREIRIFPLMVGDMLELLPPEEYTTVEVIEPEQTDEPLDVVIEVLE